MKEDDTIEPSGNIFDLPKELDMGNQPFRMVQNSKNGVTAVYLPKQERWVYTATEGTDDTFKLFESLACKIRDTGNTYASQDGKENKEAKEILVSFMKWLTEQKKGYQDYLDKEENNNEER